MHYALNELLDIRTVQALMDTLDDINKLPSAILDKDGNILTATAWQDVCTKFHRLNKSTEKKCRESDTHISAGVGESASTVIYQCPMGLVDAAAPIIIDGVHLGNVFIGQLFMESPDEAYFIQQARQYGFDETTYLEAVRKVPLCSEDQLLASINFIGTLVHVLAESGLQRRRQLESEIALRDSENKLKVIFETSEAGIMVVSPLGVITFANRRMAVMFGLHLKDLIGSHYLDYVHDTEKQAGIKSMLQIASGEKTSVELIRHYIRKDGTDFWGNLTGTRFGNVDGSMRDQIIVISDISERKRTEDVKILLEKQLQQAQKLESLGVLSGGIAHDFNNILAVINGNAYMAKIDPEEAEGYLSTIEKAVERAAGLCRQMMDYAGNTQSQQSTINLVVLVDEMVQMLRSTIPQNAVITIDCQSNFLNMLGDKNQINQIIMNLIINASEAIGEAQGEIKVALTTREVTLKQPEIDYLGREIRPNYYACLEVTDNGDGMDEETTKRIFEPFYTTKFMGRGLGMSAVLGIVTTHNGSLLLTSQVGLGTSFRILFPLQPSESVDDKAQIPVHTFTLVPMNSTILLVEDEEQVSIIASKMLNKLGFTVMEAANGVEAIETYQKYATDIKLVITDIGMPFMDGYELIPRLKSLNPALPIVVSSGFSEQTITSRISRDELAGFICKPYNIDNVINVLMSLRGDLLTSCQSTQG